MRVQVCRVPFALLEYAQDLDEMQVRMDGISVPSPHIDADGVYGTYVPTGTEVESASCCVMCQRRLLGATYVGTIRTRWNHTKHILPLHFFIDAFIDSFGHDTPE